MSCSNITVHISQFVDVQTGFASLIFQSAHEVRSVHGRPSDTKVGGLFAGRTTNQETIRQPDQFLIPMAYDPKPMMLSPHISGSSPVILCIISTTCCRSSLFCRWFCRCYKFQPQSHCSFVFLFSAMITGFAEKQHRLHVCLGSPLWKAEFIIFFFILQDEVKCFISHRSK